MPISLPKTSEFGLLGEIFAGDDSFSKEISELARLVNYNIAIYGMGNKWDLAISKD